MKIGTLARRTGHTIPTIRYYESQGLLQPRGRTEGGYRIFSPDDVDRLEFVKRAKRVGLSLAEIGAILAIRAQEEPTCEHVRALLAHKLVQVEEALRELGEFHHVLVELLDQSDTLEDCRPGGGRVCSIIEQAPVDQLPAVLEKLKRAGER